VVTQPAVSLAQDRESTPAEPAVLTTMLCHHGTVKRCRPVSNEHKRLQKTQLNDGTDRDAGRSDCVQCH